VRSIFRGLKYSKNNRILKKKKEVGRIGKKGTEKHSKSSSRWVGGRKRPGLTYGGGSLGSGFAPLSTCQEGLPFKLTRRYIREKK